jgi:transposase
MKTVEDYEQIRRAYFVEELSIREIRRRLGYSRETIRKAIANPAPQSYRLTKAREAPVLGPYQQRIIELLDESDRLPRKQRYTAHKVYEILVSEGYQGSEGSVHNYVSRQRKKRKRRQAYLPLEFDPGQDAQVDWGEAEVELAGERIKVQLFVMRLNYSRVRFVMAFPFQKQEAFFEGHIQAFHFFGGIPRRIVYDNLKTAVYKILEGKNREEQKAFKTFRSYYLFESHYCTPAQGHEKGGVENDVGYVQRNFMAPLLKVGSYQELNTFLWKACRQNVHRHVRGKDAPVAELWEEEQASLLPLPAADYPACTTYVIRPNAYSQAELDTNRYSVPVTYRDRQLVMQAYPFTIKILDNQGVIAEHPRCFGREQDVIEPLHYLPLLEQRPGAFEHAIPVRRWRKKWPREYDQLLEELRQRFPDGRGVREFIAVLKLHQDHPVELVEKAVRSALELGAAHLDGVRLCLRQLQEVAEVPQRLDLTLSHRLAEFGNQPVNLRQYDRLLGRG